MDLKHHISLVCIVAMGAGCMDSGAPGPAMAFDAPDPSEDPWTLTASGAPMNGTIWYWAIDQAPPQMDLTVRFRVELVDQAAEDIYWIAGPAYIVDACDGYVNELYPHDFIMRRASMDDRVVMSRQNTVYLSAVGPGDTCIEGVVFGVFSTSAWTVEANVRPSIDVAAVVHTTQTTQNAITTVAITDFTQTGSPVPTLAIDEQGPRWNHAASWPPDSTGFRRVCWAIDGRDDCNVGYQAMTPMMASTTGKWNHQGRIQEVTDTVAVEWVSIDTGVPYHVGLISLGLPSEPFWVNGPLKY